MTTTLIVAETSIDYLRFMWGHRPAVWVEGIIVFAAAAFVLADFVLAYLRTRTLRNQGRDGGNRRARDHRIVAGGQPGTRPRALAHRAEHRDRRIRADAHPGYADGDRDRDLLLGGQHRRAAFVAQAGQVPKGQQVTLHPEPDDHPGGHRAEV